MSSEMIINSKGNCELKLEDELTVSNSAELKNLFAQVFEKKENIEINHSKVSDIDFSYLQLLISALIKCKELDKNVFINASFPEQLSNVINDSGFANLLDSLTIKKE